MNRTLLAYLVVFVGGLLGLFVYTNDQNAKDRSGLIATCERVNVLRAQSNITDLSVWRNFSAAARREALLAKDESNGAVHQRSADDIVRNARRITVTALTDCTLAVDRSTIYKPPVAGPIGNVLTGRENPPIAVIEQQSERKLDRET